MKLIAYMLIGYFIAKGEGAATCVLFMLVVLGVFDGGKKK